MNLFGQLPASSLDHEEFSDLLVRPGVRIERIVSTGQANAPESWQDQASDEWVLLLAGAARIETEDGEITLTPGDHLFLPAHMRHRVSFTQAEPATIWLAVHMTG